jgi:CheY-like chemotaxis protein
MGLGHALIVDDSRTSAALLGKMLARSDLSSDKVISGEDCLSYLAGASPDIIFMDHMMPGMDGFDAVKAIKRQPRLAAIPIVMYTSKGGEMYIGQARALGAVGVLQKPAAEHDVMELLQCLRPAGESKSVHPPRDAQPAACDPMNPTPGINNARLAAGNAPALPGWVSSRQHVANESRAARVVLSRALIVDDSRTSAALLAKMLARHGFSSDKVLSGEASLTYLATHQPDIIFMDHMMPGMDGFDAVKAIKRQSKLAGIPIVMHTSKGGEMYIGQARALGAVGVLEKPATEEALVEVIAELQPAGAPQAIPEPDPEPDFAPEQASPESVGNMPTRQRRDRPSFLPTAASSRTRREQQRWRRRALLGGLVALMALFGALWLNSPKGAVIDRAELLDALGQLGNQQTQFAFGDIPFDDKRRAILQQIVRILELANVGAEIELRAHVGEFCRVYADSGKAVLPAGDLPIEQCDMIGYESGEAQALASSQSLDFRLFVEQVNRAAGDISIKLVPVGIFEAASAYPADSGIPLAGDWNQIAAHNQRVEILLRPAAVAGALAQSAPR